MFTPIGFAPGVPAEYYESIGQQSIADRLREAQAASNPVAPLSNAELFASASRAASSPLLQGNSLCDHHQFIKCHGSSPVQFTNRRRKPSVCNDMDSKATVWAKAQR
jgi:hypothetical protein